MSRLEAYEKFHERLASGELRAGQFVTQKELAALIGVPLGSAREAIQRLEFESLLRVYPQRGIQVTEATVQLIREAFGLRLTLEKEAARKFAINAPDAVISELRDATAAIIDRCSGEISPNLQSEAVEADWALHDSIVDHMENSIFSEVYRVNAARIRLVRGTGNRLRLERIVPALSEHLVILDACKERNADAAAAAVEAHISNSLRISLEHA